MSKRSVSERYKRKEERANDSEADTTSRLTVPGPHSHPSTTKSRLKRCVETPGDPWDIGGWSGGAMVLGKLPVRGRPTI